MGNKGVIASGDIQWMTAGSGIIHQEMPKGDDGRMEGFQLWANLPASHKMMDPRYQEVKAAEIPEVIDDDGTHVASSAANSGARRARSTASPPIRLSRCFGPPRKEKNLPVETTRHAFAYVFAGNGEILQRLRSAGSADRIGEVAGHQSAERSGQPLADPLRSRRRSDSASGK